MIFPFYNNDKKAYTIDDANIGCNRVIVSDCNNWHKYASLCELIADCPSVKQLTRDCVIDALKNHLLWSNEEVQLIWLRSLRASITQSLVSCLTDGQSAISSHREA